MSENKEKKYLSIPEIPNAKIEDLTGMKFNSLTVIRFDTERYLKQASINCRRIKHYWICECECGEIVSKDRHSLKTSKGKMCKKCAMSKFAKEIIIKNAINGYTFEDWCKDNDHQDYLDLWDYELNDKKPSEITSKCNRKYWFKCSRGLHESKHVSICKLTDGRSLFCDKCESFGQYLIDTYGEDAIKKYWSDKNAVDPFEIRKKTDRLKVFMKCENGVHADYMIRPDAFHVQTGCVNCVKERHESYLQEKVRKYINKLGYETLHEFDCNIIPRNPKNNHGLPFDNEVPKLKLVCEVMGKQHYDMSTWFINTAKRNGTTADYEFYKRKLYDRYKYYIAYKNGYEYLEIPYWAEEDDSYKDLIDNKINEILNKNGGGCIA